MNQKTPRRQYVPVRRVLTGALAAALAAACLFTAALAASPELRMAVLSFFHIEEPEQLPGGNPSGAPTEPGVSQADIGQLVKAQYIKTDRYYGLTGGLLNDLIWSEDHRILLDAKFWEIQDGELVPCRVDMRTGQVDLAFENLRYQGEFYWFVHENELRVFYGNNRGYDEALDIETDWYPALLPGRTDVLLIYLSTGRHEEYSQYPLLYHLDTGETEDVLAGTGAAELDYASDYCWSEDLRRILIETGNPPDGRCSWLCDLDAGTLITLDELTGIDVDTAVFGDNDTLILHSTGWDEEGDAQDVAVYAYDIPSGRVTKTLERTPYHRSSSENSSGVEMAASHCVLIDPDGQVRAVDLKTGAQALLDGFTFHQGDHLLFSPSGDKLLYFSTNPEADGLGIAQLGVADLERGVFFAFDREGYENLHEESIGWEDDHTVSVSASTAGGGTRYILLYRF